MHAHNKIYITTRVLKTSTSKAQLQPFGRVYAYLHVLQTWSQEQEAGSREKGRLQFARSIVKATRPEVSAGGLGNIGTCRALRVLRRFKMCLRSCALHHLVHQTQ